MDIHVYLTGRLGNQLFQYAFARHLQKKYGGRIICNIYELEHRSEKMKHVPEKFHYDMRNYKLNQNVTLEDLRLPWYADFLHPIIRVIKKIFPKQLFQIMVKQGCILWQRNDYIEIPDLKCNSVILNGWWQDFRFFHDVEKELQKEIVPMTAPVAENNQIYRIASSTNSVCISVRGGNYLVHGVKEKLFVCDRQYFFNAVEKISELISNPVFIVFSDDLEWVRKHIRFEDEFPNFPFYYESGKDPVEEKLRLMTSCKNFIISNSTFSWWAQYLAPYKEKVIVAPDIWFVNGNRNGLYMGNWLVVPTQLGPVKTAGMRQEKENA